MSEEMIRLKQIHWIVWLSFLSNGCVLLVVLMLLARLG